MRSQTVAVSGAWTPPNPFRGGQTDRTWTNSGGDMTGDLEHRKCGPSSAAAGVGRTEMRCRTTLCSEREVG
jgi:hypothetical protein